MKLTKRQKQAIATKLKIMEITFKLFQDKGYESIKIKDICDAAGISVGAFYHHFASKTEILSTSYKQVDLLLLERYNQEDYDTSIAKIKGILGEGGTVLEELGWKLVSEVYKNLITTESNYTLSETRKVFLEIKTAIESGIVSGEIKISEEPVALANTILRIARGTIFDWCLHKGEYPLKEKILEDLDLIFRNIQH